MLQPAQIGAGGIVKTDLGPVVGMGAPAHVVQQAGGLDQALVAFGAVFEQRRDIVIQRLAKARHPGVFLFRVAGSLDHEAQDSYSVTVDVFDGEHTTQQTFTIDVGDVNEAAHSVALDDNTVDENSAVGTVVGTVSADDPEGDTLSYSLSDDAGGMFTIDPNSGEIKVAGSLNHEAQDSYFVTVDVFDGENTTQQTFTIDIGDLAAPTLTGTGNTIANADMGEVVDLSHMDQFPELYEGAHLEDRVGTEVFDDMVDDAEKLVINYQSEATVTFKGETAGYRNSIGAYQINEDGTIQDVQLLWGDASSDKLTIGESQATYTGIEQGSELGFFIISNGFSDLPDDAVSGDGNTISDTGTWMFVSPDFDPTTQNPSDHQYNVNTDSGPPQMIYVEGDGTIHTQSGNVFHSLRQEDFNPDASVDSREHFVAGVDAENGVLHFGIEDLMGGGDADFDDTMFSVEIDARDLVEAPNPLFSQDELGRSSFEITDTDSADLTDATVVVGDIQAGDSVTIGGGYQLDGGVVKLPDGSSTGISYSIVDDGSDITVTLTGSASVDLYESVIQSINFSNDGSGGDAAGVRTIDVSVTDSSGEASDDYSSTLTVEAAPNSAPDNVALADNAVDENSAIGTVVGTVTADDAEGDTLSYSLTDDAGGMFTIDASSGEIKVAGALDYETTSSYSVTVQVSDGTTTADQTFTIDVSDLAEGITETDDPGLQGSANIVGTSGDDKAGSEGKLMGSNHVDDVIYGLEGDDDLIGKQGEDTLVGGDGSDTLDGGDDADSLYGGAGDDRMDGGQGDDIVQGNAGDDVMYGDKDSNDPNGGDDTLMGGAGADKIYGESGDDVLYGGAGDDEVYGGDGSDIFYFASDEGNDEFYGGEGSGWSDTIVLTDGMPAGDVSDWLTLTSGSVESTASGEIFLSEDAAGTISLDGGNAVLTFEGVEKIEA